MEGIKIKEIIRKIIDMIIDRSNKGLFKLIIDDYCEDKDLICEFENRLLVKMIDFFEAKKYKVKRKYNLLSQTDRIESISWEK